MTRLPILFLIAFIALCITSYVRAENSKTNVYKIGINDVLEISVIDHDNLRTVASVASDGTISFPYIGIVMVKGKEISEIEEEITKRLSEGYIKFPVVVVSLVKSLSRKIYTFGEVLRRGIIEYEDNMTVFQTLSIIGGVTEKGQNGRLVIKRKVANTKNKYNVFLEAELNEGRIASRHIEDMILQPDDILIVESSRTFLIEGDVVQRGRFTLERGMTVLRALLQAGGIAEDGLYGLIKVKRSQEKGESGRYIDFAESKIGDGVIEKKDVEDIILEPDDILIVESNDTLLIQGEAASRGRIVLEKDMTVLKALLQAGGVTSDGLHGRLKIRRKEAGSVGRFTDIAESKLNDGILEKKEVEDIVLLSDDILIVERNETFLIQGAVASRGRIVLEKDMTVLKALLQAGGVSTDGLHGRLKVRRKEAEAVGGYTNIAESKLIDGVLEKNDVEDIILKADDIIVVEPNRTILVYGEVNKVGEYILQDPMTVLKTITLAGGFTKWGSKSSVKVLRKRNDNSGIDTIKINMQDVIDGDMTKDITLKEGDIVVVTTGIF